jgi:hypothetical protein
MTDPETAELDVAAPWTIKAIPGRLRVTIIAAARREGVNVAQWLERLVREWESDGSPVSPGPQTQADLAGLTSLMAEARAMAAAADVPVSKVTARRALALLNTQLRAARGPTPPRRQPLRITNGNAENKELTDG